MSNLPSVLAEALTKSRRPGDFYATGTVDMHPLRLEVDGIGQISLPLLPVQAAQLVDMAEQAPYGRGEETLVDTDVRRTWQVDATRLRISGRRWTEDLAQIVTRATQGLGVAGRVEAELYKLLIYDTGSFFLPHRDTEKTAGMFATLVVVLPSPFSGGELIVRHGHQEARLELSRDEPSEIAYAAFYADCKHEVLPVASGYRLALVYNLVRPDGEPVPRPPDNDATRTAVTNLLRSWHGAPLKLAYPLEHAYSEAELGFDTLKGADAAAAGLLLAAAEAAECKLGLGILTLYEYGIAEHTGDGYYSRGYYDDDDDEFEIIEATDNGQVIEHLTLSDGDAFESDRLLVEDDELCPPDALADFDDMDPEFSEATGNEGASYERQYQCAALVLWPRANHARLIAATGLSQSLPYLENLLHRWQQSGAAPDSAEARQARALTTAIHDTWPNEDWAARNASEAGYGGALMGALAALGDTRTAQRFIAEQVAFGAYAEADNPIVTEVLSTLPADEAGELLEAVIAGNATLKPVACAALLASCVQQLDIDQSRAAAQALLDALPGSKAQSDDEQTNYWRRQPPSPKLVADTLSALSAIDSALTVRATSLFLSESQHYPVDSVLIPAALLLRARSQEGQQPTELRDAILAYLDRRIAEPLAPPNDWRRNDQIDCQCPHCMHLSSFLRSPTESVWKFKAAQQTRDHLKHRIERAECDLDCSTDKRGRPYTLICAKNQASYERAVEQRERDLENRAKIAG